MDPAPFSFDICEGVLVFFFALDYGIQFYSASSRLQFVCKFRSIIDLLTILPALLVITSSSDFSLVFLRTFRILRLFRILRVHRFLNFGYGVLDNETIHQQVFVMLVSVFCLIFCSAGIFQIVENSFDDESVDFGVLAPPSKTQITFFNSVYFIVITGATVGFGDIVPRSAEGRLFTICFVLSMMIIVPVQSGHLVRLVFTHSRFRGAITRTPGFGHIVVSSPASLYTVGHFFSEFFHPAFGGHRFHVLAMNSNIPSEKDAQFLREGSFRKRVQYLQGSPTSEYDLIRCAAKHSAGFFFLTAKVSKNPFEEDSKTVMKVLSVRSFDPNCELYVQVLLPQTAYQLVSMFSKAADTSNDFTCEPFLSQASSHKQHVVCVREFALNLLALNCRCPGLTTLVSGWMRKEPGIVCEPDSWMSEYTFGLSHSVFPVRLPLALNNRTFGDIAQILFHAFNVVVFGYLGPTSAASQLPASSSHADLPSMLSRKFRSTSQAKMRRINALAENIADKNGDIFICPNFGQTIHGHDIIFVLALDSQTSVRIANLTFEDVSLIEQQMLAAGLPVTSMLSESSSAFCDVVSFPQARKFADVDAGATGFLRKPSETVPLSLLHAAQNLVDRMKIKLSAASVASEYRLCLEPRPFDESIILKNFEKEGHIIVCGEPHAFEHFILPLRSRRIKNPPAIILLCHPSFGRRSSEETRNASLDSTTPEWWDNVSLFPDVFVCFGSSQHTFDLEKCNIMGASRVVCLAQTSFESTVMDEETYGNYVDFVPILTHHHVEKYLELRRKRCEKLQKSSDMDSFASTVELVNGSSMRYLQSMSGHVQSQFGAASKPADEFLNPCFASGRAFVDCVLDSLMVQSFFHPQVLDVFSQLTSCFGSTIRRRTRLKKRRTGEDDDIFTISRIEVPSEFVGSTYAEFYSWSLRTEQCIPVGIYRQRSFMGAPCPYVYGTPRRESILNEGDMIFTFVREKIGTAFREDD
eukprot:ANDGO_00255.mRNA.1 Calcium-activated potassium channel slowpoke